MKTTNLQEDGNNAGAIAHGFKAPKRATAGMPLVTDSLGNEVLANRIHFADGSGLFITDDDENTAIVSGTGVDPDTGTVAGPLFDVTEFGATGDGTTLDCDAINDAIDAFNDAGGGKLYFPAGTYLCNAGLNALTAPGIVTGDGIAATVINCSSATANLFTHTTGALERAPSFRDMTINNTHATPTAGAGIRCSAGGNYANYARLRMENWWVGIRHEDGSAWGAVAVTMNSIRKYGLHISNVATPDEGDWFITNCAIVASTHSPDAAIRIDSSGGGKIIGCKVNGSNPATGYNYGIEVAIAGTDTTGVLIIDANTIENLRGDGIHITQAGTAAYSFFNITDNDIHLQSNNTGKAVSIVAEDASNIRHVQMSGNTFWTDGTIRTPVAVTNVENITFGGNLSAGNFKTGYDATTTVKIVDGDYHGHPLVIFPQGLEFSNTQTTNATADVGRAVPVNFPGPMWVRSMWIHISTAGSGQIEWGLFALTNNLAAASRICGGQAAPGGTGWREIAASSAPIYVPAGTYMLIVENPATNQSTITVYSLSAAPGFIKSQTTYAWDDTPDLTSGWSDNTAMYLCYIEGDMSAAGTRW